jgi:hypothetical protein
MCLVPDPGSNQFRHQLHTGNRLNRLLQFLYLLIPQIITLEKPQKIKMLELGEQVFPIELIVVEIMPE